MPTLVKKVKKRTITATFPAAHEVAIIPGNEVLMPTTQGATPDFTYTVVESDFPLVLGADDIGYEVFFICAVAVRGVGGTNASAVFKVYINDVLYNSYSGSLYNKIQGDMTFVCPCKIGDVIKVYATCATANYASLSYYRYALRLARIGLTDATGKNKAIMLLSVKQVSWAHALEITGSVKTWAFDNAYSAIRRATTYALATSKYANTSENENPWATGPNDGKFLAGVTGQQPRNTGDSCLYGIARTFYDTSYTTTSVDTSVVIMSCTVPVKFEVEYITP